jgi:hypothetical protein
MRVDRKWVERNLGFDPIATPPPDATFASARAAKAATPEDFQREIIDFDSESPAGLQFMSFTTATGLSRYTDVEWPKGLAPKTGRAPSGGSNSPLPHADVLVVTWTVDEGHALSRVLTPARTPTTTTTPTRTTLGRSPRRCEGAARRSRQSVWAHTGPRPSAADRS